MKKQISALVNAMLLTMLFCIGCSKTNSNVLIEEDNETETLSAEAYYWYRDEKIPLLKNSSKSYILFETKNEAEVNSFLSHKNVTVIKAAQNLNLSSSRQPHNSDQMPENLKWMIVSGGAGPLATATSPILYEGAFFNTEKGDEIGAKPFILCAIKRQPDGLISFGKPGSQK